MLWCDNVAPLGKPVVPDVYWMLIGSSNDSVASRSCNRCVGVESPRSANVSHCGEPRKIVPSSPPTSSRTPATMSTYDDVLNPDALMRSRQPDWLST